MLKLVGSSATENTTIDKALAIQVAVQQSKNILSGQFERNCPHVDWIIWKVRYQWEKHITE